MSVFLSYFVIKARLSTVSGASVLQRTQRTVTIRKGLNQERLNRIPKT